MSAGTTPGAVRRARSDDGLALVLREFVRHPSPWIIATFLAASVVARFVIGDVRTSDLVLVAGLLAVQPLVEWVIHVTVLHWRPRRVLGRTVDFLLARQHRAHHADPADPELVYIPWPVLLWLVPLEVLVAVVAFDRPGLGATYLVTAGLVGIVYEWTHYLVHSDHRPRSAFYRAIWRHHRLHHYKNEHYWLAISRTWPDRILRTAPEPASVETSPTVRALHAPTTTG